MSPIISAANAIGLHILPPVPIQNLFEKESNHGWTQSQCCHETSWAVYTISLSRADSRFSSVLHMFGCIWWNNNTMHQFKNWIWGWIIHLIMRWHQFTYAVLSFMEIDAFNIHIMLQNGTVGCFLGLISFWWKNWNIVVLASIHNVIHIFSTACSHWTFLSSLDGISTVQSRLNLSNVLGLCAALIVPCSFKEVKPGRYQSCFQTYS